MYKKCKNLLGNIYKNLYNKFVIDSFLEQTQCVFHNNLCVGEYDILIYASEEYLYLCNDLIDYLELYCVDNPRVNIIFNNDNIIQISTVGYYFENIIAFFNNVFCKIEHKAFFVLFKSNSLLIKIYKTLCNECSCFNDKYSDIALIGKLMSLCDALKESIFTEVDNYPQFAIMLNKKLQTNFYYLHLHDLAIYIYRYYELIDWHRLLTILSHVEVNTYFIFLIKIFNYIYNLIPDNEFKNYLSYAKVGTNLSPPETIIADILNCCTINEILNNDYRNCYSMFLTDFNIINQEYYYPELDSFLSFSENRLMFYFDQNKHINPFGSAVFHGSSKDDSDGLFLSWGLWQCSSKLCFLLKFHNKFITIENSYEKLKNCRIQIPIVAFDNQSFKYTEICIYPIFNNFGELSFYIIDEMGEDLDFENNVEFKYEKKNNIYYITLCVEKEYLCISETGMFGMDMLISCADSWSEYSSYSFRKTLSCFGSEKHWRDFRTYARMLPQP